MHRRTTSFISLATRHAPELSGGVVEARHIRLPVTIEGRRVILLNASERLAYLTEVLAADTIDAAVGVGALRAACRDGHVGIMRRLVEPGVDVNAAPADGWRPGLTGTLLHVEVMDSHDGGLSAGALELLRLGANVDALTKDLTTPLGLATWAGTATVVSQLLAAGADVNAQNDWGRTPTINAVDYGKPDALRVLLAAPGVDVHRVDIEGHSALWHASKLRDSSPLAAMLEAAGAGSAAAAHAAYVKSRWDGGRGGW